MTPVFVWLKTCRACCLVATFLAIAPAMGAVAHERTSASQVVIQVDENDPETMSMALNNVRNIYNYYDSQGTDVTIEVVTYGPGVTMLRNDISPMKEKIAELTRDFPDLTLSACANTIKGIEATNAKKVELVPGARIVPSGAVRLLELQGEGYAYLRP